jgi:hypothetical protein
LSILWGQGHRLREADRYDGAANIIEGWADEYGSVFTSPGPLGTVDIVVTDPKAVAHIYAGMEVRMCAARRAPALKVGHRPRMTRQSSARGKLLHS